MVRSYSLLQKKLTLATHPPFMNIAKHTHRLNNLCVTDDTISVTLSIYSTTICSKERLLDTAFINNTNGELHKSTCHSEPTKAGSH